MPGFLADIKGRIIVGISREDIEAYVRQRFHDSPELSDTRLYGVLEQALVYKLDSREQTALAVKLQLLVEELQRRITVLEQRQAEWKLGHELFAIPDLVRNMITVKAKANSRSKRKR